MKNNQITHSIKITKLKHLKEVTIPLDEKPITAVMGPNCSGKTTVIHALACCYQPENSIGEYHRFSDYFIPSTYERWNGSDFKMEYSFSDRGTNNEHVVQNYKKADRWVPRYDRRPERPSFYIGIDSCVPLVEKETQSSMIYFVESIKSGPNFKKVIDCMSEIFNRNYSELYELNRFGRIHTGVSCNGLKYSELTMGAGEQRIFKLLDKIISGPKYALYLVDEIDLLMHQFALSKLIDQLNIILQEKKQQLVFTSHNQYLARRTNDIKIIHLLNTSDKTMILKDTNIEAIYRLSGYNKDLRKYELYVEDYISARIVESLLIENGIKKHCDIIKFGPAINAFTIAAGTIIKDRNIKNKYFILDGDVLSSSQEIQDCIEKVLTGNVEPYNTYRNEVKENIVSYSTIEGKSPEAFLSDAIKSLNDDILDESGKMIKRVVFLRDKHKYITDLVDCLGVSYEQSVQYFIQNAKLNADKWNSFVEPINVIINKITREIEKDQ